MVLCGDFQQLPTLGSNRYLQHVCKNFVKHEDTNDTHFMLDAIYRSADDAHKLFLNRLLLFVDAAIPLSLVLYRQATCLL